MNALEGYVYWWVSGEHPDPNRDFEKALKERFPLKYEYATWLVKDQRERMKEAKLVTLWSEEYPPLLREIPKAPFGFFCVGDCLVLRGEMVSVVGTRRASGYGKGVARAVGSETAREFVVVSGMAYGIDSAAHEGALEAGWTVAVLASGADVPTPKGNSSLYRRIIERGCVISPYPLGDGARKERFVERNSIIAGLSIATVVVEAPERSGALTTASFAADFGRDVFAVPADITRKVAEGSNRLLLEGAIPLISPSGVLEYYGKEIPKPEDTDAILMAVMEGADPQDIAERLGMELSEVLARLTELEMEGRVFRDGGTYRAI